LKDGEWIAINEFLSSQRAGNPKQLKTASAPNKTRAAMTADE